MQGNRFFAILLHFICELAWGYFRQPLLNLYRSQNICFVISVLRLLPLAFLCMFVYVRYFLLSMYEGCLADVIVFMFVILLKV